MCKPNSSSIATDVRIVFGMGVKIAWDVQRNIKTSNYILIFLFKFDRFVAGRIPIFEKSQIVSQLSDQLSMPQ